MAQRDYISQKNRQVRSDNRRNVPALKKATQGKSPYMLIAIILLVLMIFVGGLYFMMNNAPADEVAQQATTPQEGLPPPPIDKWKFINELESGSTPVSSDPSNTNDLEQEALNALIAQQLGLQNGTQTVDNTVIDPTTNAEPVVTTNSSTQVPPIADGINQGSYIQPNETSQPSSDTLNNPTINALENELAKAASQAGSSQTNLNQNGYIQPEITSPTITEQALLQQQAIQKQQILEQEKALAAQNAAKEKALAAQKEAKEKAKFEAQELARLKKLEEQKAATLKIQKENAAKLSTQQAVTKGWQLQCGSFSDRTKADSVKAQLAFNGVQSNVVKAGNYNRVMIGSFSTRQDANSMIPRAQAAGVPNCIILAP